MTEQQNKELKNYLEREFDLFGSCINVETHIAEIERILAPKWASVQEGLPPKNEIKAQPLSKNVLGLTEGGLRLVCCYDHEFHVFQDIGGYTVNITHWMPLPELPESTTNR